MHYPELKAHLDLLERAALGAFMADAAHAARLEDLKPELFSSVVRGRLFSELHARWTQNLRNVLGISHVLKPLVENGTLSMAFPARFLIGLKMDHETFPRPDTLLDELVECAAYVKMRAAEEGLKPTTSETLIAPDAVVPDLSAERNTPVALAETECWTLDDLDQEGEAQDELWQGLLAVGSLTLLHSRPKLGKSFTMFGLVKNLTQGLPFLGQTTKPGGVIWLTEESRQTLKEKREVFQLMRPAPVGFLSRRAPNLAALNFTEALDVACKLGRKRNARLLIVDTLGAWASLDTDTENHAARIEQLFHRIKAMAVANGLAALVLHHTEKRGKSARGSTALEAAADVVLRLASVRNRLNRRILSVKSRFGDAPEQIEFDYKDGEFVADIPECESMEKVWKLIPDQAPGITIRELIERSGCAQRTIYDLIPILANKNEIIQDGLGTKNCPVRICRKNDCGDIGHTGVASATAIKQVPENQEVMIAEPQSIPASIHRHIPMSCDTSLQR